VKWKSISCLAQKGRYFQLATSGIAKTMNCIKAGGHTHVKPFSLSYIMRVTDETSLFFKKKGKQITNHMYLHVILKSYCFCCLNACYSWKVIVYAVRMSILHASCGFGALAELQQLAGIQLTVLIRLICM